MTTQQQIDTVYRTYQRALLLYREGVITLEELDAAFDIYRQSLQQLGPVNEEAVPSYVERYQRERQFCEHGQYRSLCPECSPLA